jgi:hypothetical protein
VSSTVTGSTGTAIGTIQELGHLIKMYPVKEIIFCEDGLSFKDITGIIQQLPRSLRNKFHASGSNSIVGSDDKDISGKYVAENTGYAIASPVNKRNKNLLDIIVSLILLLSFPLHLVLQKKPLQFFKNLLAIFARQKTWVGYAVNSGQLPAIKSGIITSTSLPAVINSLPEESLHLSDEWYASSYSITTDINTIIRGYKYLCY